MSEVTFYTSVDGLAPILLQSEVCCLKKKQGHSFRPWWKFKGPKGSEGLLGLFESLTGPRIWRLGVVLSTKIPVDIRVNEISGVQQDVFVPPRRNEWTDPPGPMPLENAGTFYFVVGQKLSLKLVPE